MLRSLPNPFFSALKFLLIISFLFPLTASAEEKITNFQSRIEVGLDGSLFVTETITVNSEGNQIQRGIFRDIPTRYQDKNGTTRRVGFDVISVSRDGDAEEYALEPILGFFGTGGIRIRIGNKDVFLNNGQHRYEIQYRTTRQLRFFDTHDELYWNVTGNGWSFPIYSVDAWVILPTNVPLRAVTHEAYTGPEGAKGKDYVSKPESSGAIYYRTTRPFDQGEGLTIVAGWPKGYVHQPTSNELTREFVQDNLPALIGLCGLALVFLYYLYIWNSVGRDPTKGTIIPLYSEPADLSPADVRYLTRMGYDQTCFAAAVLNMAVKGFLQIEEGEGVYAKEYTLKKISDDQSGLSEDEKQIAEIIFNNSSSLALKQTNYRRLNKTKNALTTFLEKKHFKKHFNYNHKYLTPGTLISIATLVLASVSFRGETMAMVLFMIIWLSFWSVGVLALGTAVYTAWKGVFSGTAGPLGFFGAIFITLFATPFFIGEAFGAYLLFVATSAAFVFVLLGSMLLCFIFYHLLKAPTKEGRKLLDKIEGFKMYLGTAERDNLKSMQPVNRNAETFEKFLPFALALGVEQQWAEKFATLFAAEAAQMSQSFYSPSWYRGGSFNGATSFANSFASSFSSAISSSSSSSSSGSGGGGSSGGGGGGGGGGGW